MFSPVFILKKYTNNGTTDINFGDSGVVITDVGLSTSDVLTSLIYQPNGKIVAGGYTGQQTGSATNKFALCRYLADGRLDITFGKEGKLISDLKGDGEELNALALQNDGKIVAVGVSNNDAFYSTMMIARYTVDGQLDNSFGVQGQTEISFDKKYPQATSVNIQSNGKIISTGWAAEDLETQLSNFALTRINQNGSIDSTFGTDGRVITDFGAYDYCYSSNLQDDGKILCAGQQYPLNGGNETNILIARYYGDPVRQLGPIAKKIRRWIRNHTLQWQPVNDNDISYYSIQQSSNGFNGFKEIARISKNSKLKNKNEETVYSYSLNNAAANSFYRITAVSNSGSNITSEVIADESFSSITISPNPVKDVMKISGLPANQKSTINIINRNGNILQSVICNSSIYNMNIGQLKSGFYTVQVITNGKTQTVKMVKE